MGWRCCLSAVILLRFKRVARDGIAEIGRLCLLAATRLSPPLVLLMTSSHINSIHDQKHSQDLPRLRFKHAGGTVNISDVVLVGASANGGCGFDPNYACPATVPGPRLPRLATGSDTCGHRVGIMAAVWDPWTKPLPRDR